MSICDFFTDGIAESEAGFRIRRYDGGSISCTEQWDGPAACACLLRASGRVSDGNVEIVVERHAILRYTPCGAWIDRFGGEKFVNLRAGKQWASVTETEAVDQLYHRKRTQVRILESRFAEAKAVQAAMEKHLGKKAPPPRAWRSSGYDYY